MGNFLKDHFGTSFSILTSIITLVYALGIQRATLDEHTRELQLANERIAVISNDAHESKWSLVKHDQTITELKENQKEAVKAISDIKSDVRLIAEWVRDQKHQGK